MLIIDLTIVGLTLAACVWGYVKGLSVSGLGLIGFGAGAIIGSRVAPLILVGGFRDPWAPVVALPAALLVGALLAAVLERFGFRLRRQIQRFNLLDGLGGAVVAGFLGLVAVWILAAVVARVDSLRDPVRDSAIIEQLNAVLPPPGPLLTASERSDPLPVIAGPRARVAAPTGGIKRDADVRSAAGSILKVIAVACGHDLVGTGWIGADGTVVTNAHVVAGSDEMRVQVGGSGPLRDAEAIWYDAVSDIAILRSDGVRGVPVLPLDLKARPGTPAAVLGFPGGGPYKVTPARLGGTSRVPGFRTRGGEFRKKRITSMRAAVRPGNSGGPVVDGRGQVATMVFAGAPGGHSAYGVPGPVVGSALRRAGPPVDTGRCASD